jgi:hypothetical protein
MLEKSARYPTTPPINRRHDSRDGSIALIQGAVSRLGGTPSLEDVQREVLSSIPITDINTASDAREAVEQLRELASQSGSIGAATAQLRLQKDEEETIPPGVHLLDAHLGKGQQFGLVTQGIREVWSSWPAGRGWALRVLDVAVLFGAAVGRLTGNPGNWAGSCARRRNSWSAPPWERNVPAR